MVALLPNITAAVVGFAACAAIGATWAVSAPEFGAAGVAARFGPLAPRVLITVDRYRYGGKDYDRGPQVRELIGALTSLELVIAVGVDAPTSWPRTVRVIPFDDLLAVPATLSFDRVPFDHPLWVLFSSGTTGPPHPDLERIWRLCHRHRVTMLGVAAGFIDACMSSGIVPAAIAGLGSLTTLRVTGLPFRRRRSTGCTHRSHPTCGSLRRVAAPTSAARSWGPPPRSRYEPVASRPDVSG